jgi:arginase family enzyme
MTRDREATDPGPRAGDGSEAFPWFAGRQTFLRAPLVELDGIRAGMTVISGAPHSLRPRFGERGGPRGIREGSLPVIDRLRNAPSEGLVDVATGRRLFWPGERRLVDVGDLNVYPSDVMRTTEGIAGGVAEIVRRGAFSVCLGGDHYVGYPSCLGYTRALRERAPHARVGYVHIDGHLDFADTSGAYGKYNNGTNARRISELPAIVPSSMVFVGIQGPCYLEQVESLRRLGATIFTSEDVESLGPAEVGRRAGELAIKGCDWIYVSFDIDVIDAGFFDGTGSVTMGAMTAQTLFRILEPLAQYPIGSMDFVETAPPLDPSGRSPLIAAQALIKVLTPRIFDTE